MHRTQWWDALLPTQCLGVMPQKKRETEEVNISKVSGPPGSEYSIPISTGKLDLLE